MATAVLPSAGNRGNRVSTEQLGMKVAPLIFSLLSDLNRDAIRVRPCVLSNSGHLPRHFLVCLPLARSSFDLPLFQAPVQSPVDGSMTADTFVILLAGNPPHRACSSMMSESGAT